MNRGPEQRQDSLLHAVSRPPRRAWPDAPIHHGARVLILLALAATITALFPPIQQTRVRSFEPGTVAEEDEVARLSFNVPKTSEELVNDRAEARGSVPPTFDHLSTAADTMEARLARFFSRVDQGIDVLWEAGASVSTSRIDKLIADPGIGTNAKAYGLHVSAESFCQIRYFIH